ncbi:hypothetical protein ACP4OV_022082 [Aristida adscensionis]
MAAARANLSMKLLIDTSKQRVLFGEAGKDVVDFLFSMLQLPVGAVVNMLAGKDMAGAIANVYASLDRLDGAILPPGGGKDAYLHPTLTGAATGGSPPPPLLLPPPPPSSSLSKKPVRRPSKGNGGAAGAGLVNGVVTYTVMDDLSVNPMSSISSITLLSKFGVNKLDELEERTVNLGPDDGLELLKASLQSRTVLTDVFTKAGNGSRRGKKQRKPCFCLVPNIEKLPLEDIKKAAAPFPEKRILSA